MPCRDGSPYAVVVGTTQGIDVYSCGCTVPSVSEDQRKELWTEITGFGWEHHQHLIRTEISDVRMTCYDPN